jgi:hypothetical protein
MRRSSAVALLVMLIVACSAVPSGAPSPTPPTASPPTPTSTPESTALPSTTPSVAPAAWTETYGSELTELRDVLAGPQGFIASGCMTDASGNCLRGLLLLSPDGTSWIEAALDGAADTLISRVRRVADRLFAIGLRIDNEALKVEPVVWTSHDGRSWSRSYLASSTSMAINDVIDSPRGTLAIGIHAPYASEGSGFVVWHVAADGSVGEPTDVHPTDAIYVAGAVWTGTRFLAWGPGSALGEVLSTVLVASTDGKAWKVLPEVSAFGGSYVSQIVASGDRLVAVGTTGGSWPTSPRAWTSADGATWEAADVPTKAGAMYTAEVEGSRLVARGKEPVGAADRPVTWDSADGMTWTRLLPGEDMPDVVGFDALYRAVVDDRACVAGTFSGDPREPKPRASIYCR